MGEARRRASRSWWVTAMARSLPSKLTETRG
jgi:hypothetical protein